MKYFIHGWILTLAFSSLAHAQTQFCGLKCSPNGALESKINSSDQGTKLVSGALTALTSSCFATSNMATAKETPLIIGARKAMAIAYGSCEAVRLPALDFLEKKEIYDGVSSKINLGNAYPNNAVPASRYKTVLNSHPYLEPLLKSECSTKEECSSSKIKGEIDGVLPECKKVTCDAILFPPLYQFGFRANDQTIIQHTKTSRGAVNGIDCSGFLSESMSLMGLNAIPNKPVAQGGFGTSTFASFGAQDQSGKPVDCFDRVEEQVGVRPGDLYVVSGTHMISIDTVGPDPFNILPILDLSPQAMVNDYLRSKGKTSLSWNLEDILNGTSLLSNTQKFSILNDLIPVVCESELDSSLFKVTIIESSSNANNLGIQRATVKLGLDSTSIDTVLFQKAKLDCIRTFRSKWEERIPGLAATTNAALKYYSIKPKTQKTARVLRHISDREGCTSEPRQRPGVSCADCCNLSTSYEDMVPTAAAKGVIVDAE